MKIYHYDGTTGEYLGESDARVSPLESGVYLIPANATKEKPPKKTKGKALAFISGVWSLVPDHRGEEFYSIVDGSPVEVKSIGWVPDETVTKKKKQAGRPFKWQDDDWVVDLREETLKEILSLEASVTPRRLREAILSSEGLSWLSAVNAQIETLRLSLEE